MLYEKYRVRDLEKFVGNDSLIKSLKSKIKSNKLPNAILFSGPSGVGKTSLAKILSRELGIDQSNTVELNASSARGIETIREIEEESLNRPIFGDRRCYIIDEAHKLTKDAQSALLKITEDVPEYQYYFFCTTEPNKLDKALLSRFDHIKLKSLSQNDLEKVVLRVFDQLDELPLDKKVLSKIVELSDGSARVALNLLEKTYDLNYEDAKDILETYSLSDQDPNLIDLCRSLVGKDGISSLIQFFKVVDKQEPESIRIVILNYLYACLSRSKSCKDMERFMRFIEPLKESVIYSGKAGLLSNLIKSKQQGSKT